MLPAAALGSVISVSNKDYHPIPRPSSSAEVFENFGDKPVKATPIPTHAPTHITVPKNNDQEQQGRVEFVKPRERASNRVTLSRSAVSKTPHAAPSPSKVVPTFENPAPSHTSAAPTGNANPKNSSSGA